MTCLAHFYLFAAADNYGQVVINDNLGYSDNKGILSFHRNFFEKVLIFVVNFYKSWYVY